MAITNELANKTNFILEEERFKIMLQSTTLQLNGRNLASVANPAARRYALDQVGSQANQQRSGRHDPLPGDFRHRLSHREGGAESAYRTISISDGFSCFSERLRAIPSPRKFKPSNHTKYDGKTEPWQWLRVYSTAVELVGGNNDIKALFLPMALEPVPLQWFDKLRPSSVHS